MKLKLHKSKYKKQTVRVDMEIDQSSCQVLRYEYEGIIACQWQNKENQKIYFKNQDHHPYFEQTF